MGFLAFISETQRRCGSEMFNCSTCCIILPLLVSTLTVTVALNAFLLQVKTRCLCSTYIPNFQQLGRMMFRSRINHVGITMPLTPAIFLGMVDTCTNYLWWWGRVNMALLYSRGGMTSTQTGTLGHHGQGLPAPFGRVHGERIRPRGRWVVEGSISWRIWTDWPTTTKFLIVFSMAKQHMCWKWVFFPGKHEDFSAQVFDIPGFICCITV